MLCWKPTKPAPVVDAEFGGERLDARAILAVADEHEQCVDVPVDERAQRPDEVERPLDRGQPPRPADDEGLRDERRARARIGARAASSASLQAGRSKPYGTTDEALGAARHRSATRSSRTSSLTAISVPDVRASTRSIRRKTRSQRRLK